MRKRDKKRSLPQGDIDAMRAMGFRTVEEYARALNTTVEQLFS